MRIILSRKGFDSSATSGGVPSPIFPDGRVLSLPIPDTYSTVTYASIRDSSGHSIGPVVENLTASRARRITRDWRAHIDPDLASCSLGRSPSWRPIFGQQGAAQTHLKNQGVSPGDCFLFFGLFREAELNSGHYRFVPGTRPKHVIFGWLSIGKMCNGSALRASGLYNYHPHVAREYTDPNVVYVAAEHLALNDGSVVPGAGVFPFYDSRLRLTAPGQTTSKWLLPSWFHPEGQAPSLTYHQDTSRWTPHTDGVLLQTVAKGQEFVLSCEDYPEACDWLAGLFRGLGIADTHA